MSTFFTSDLHLGHRKIIEFEAYARPFDTVEDMNEAIVDRWNKTVNKKDVVWVLGDVVFGVENFQYLDRLNGIKKLVLGNHDTYPIQRYMQHFKKIQACVKFQDCLLTHVPVHPSQLAYRFKANIHGHLHSNLVQYTSPFGTPHEDKRYINVGLEQNNLCPIAWEDIKQRINNL